MFNTLLISVDAGKGETKYCYEKEGQLVKSIFATRGRKLRDEEDAELSSRNYEVEFNGERWGIGDSYENKDNRNSKNTDLHKLTIYTAICEALVPDSENNNVILTVTAPATLANNKDEKANFANNLKGFVEIKVNGENYSFTITKVAVKAESTGALYRDTTLFKDKNVLSVDLGYLNLNSCAINRMKIMQDSLITDTLGMQTLHVMLNDALNKYNDGRRLNTQKLNDALDEGFYKKGNEKLVETISIIEGIKSQFVDNVITLLQEKHYLDDFDSVIFSGATCKVIESTIKDRIKNAYIIEDPQFANVVGLYYWMKAKLI